jgi:hypothetical protein
VPQSHLHSQQLVYPVKLELDGSMADDSIWDESINRWLQLTGTSELPAPVADSAQCHANRDNFEENQVNNTPHDAEQIILLNSLRPLSCRPPSPAAVFQYGHFTVEPAPLRRPDGISA